MNKELKALEGQTIFDMALQETGMIENAYPIFIHNLNIGYMTSFDEDISNKLIQISSDLLINNSILVNYSKNNIKVINQ